MKCKRTPEWVQWRVVSIIEKAEGTTGFQDEDFEFCFLNNMEFRVPEGKSPYRDVYKKKK